MSKEKKEGAASDLAETLARNMAPRIETIKRGNLEEASVLLIPEGMKAVDLKPYLEANRLKPAARRGRIVATRVDSFIEIVNRFKNDALSVLFASATIEEQSAAAKITAIFDYHPESDDVTKAENAQDRASYEFPLAKDFKKWLSNNTKGMSQLDFALFIEARINEVATPTAEDKALVERLKPKFADAPEMLELSRNLEIYSNESFVSKNKLSSGEYELKFTNNHVDGSGRPLHIPDFFVIRVPIFEGGEPQRLLACLRYRKKDQTLVWFYELYRVDKSLEAAFEEACDLIKTAVKLPLYHGIPAA